MFLFRKKEPEEPDMPAGKRLAGFLALHWRGLVVLLAPLIGLAILMPLPAKTSTWCGYGLFVMAVYWISECIPLACTSFIPIALFPLVQIIGTLDVCKCYFNGTIMMFIASLMLAAAIEQSGLHLRIALNAIKRIGYSHYKLLFAVAFVTMAISMWITNTAAATMMVPIVFALLRVFEKNNFLTIYNQDKDGNSYASKLTVCYFCMTTYAATIGGIGTLVGTGTNLVFRGLYRETYPFEPDHLNFVKFSMFSVPFMLWLQIATYLIMIIQFFGFLRPRSAAAKLAKVDEKGIGAAKGAVEERLAELGKMTWWECMVLLFFATAMIGFFSRSPQVFTGWGDSLCDLWGVPRGFISDSGWASFILFLMLLLPGTLIFFKNFRRKASKNELPTERAHSIIKWKPLNSAMPWSFVLLLGGGFALSTAAGADYSNLNDVIGEQMKKLSSLPHEVTLLIVVVVTIFITNFASNVVVANVLVPISMKMAEVLNRHPLWYNIAAGFCASFCFCVPVGTPGNLVVQAAANIKTKDMICAGLVPSIATIVISWVCLMYYAPIVWTELRGAVEIAEEEPQPPPE